MYHLVLRFVSIVAQKILVVKLDWGKELGRIQDMQRETRRLFRHVEREKTFGRAKEAHERAKKELEDLQRRQQEERQQDQSHVKTFYLEISQSKAEHLRELVKKVQEEDGLREVIHNLLKDFNVRLLGIDSGLRFLLDVPVEEYEDVLRQQDDMKKLLEQACPDMIVEDDHLNPFIRAIIVTQSGQLVMADWNNSMLKICDLNNRTVENTLIVSCTSDDDGPASVDVITRHGGFLQTLLNTSMVHELDSPEYLWKHGGELLVSDPCANAVHRLQVDKKCPVTKLAHSFLQFPHQTVVTQSCFTGGRSLGVTGAGHFFIFICRAIVSVTLDII
nr:hypothetical protein BaRGS_029875 [Batillaria attramentaria]